jgi:effector-binding domain-containing protein
MSYECEIKEQATVPTLTIRGRTAVQNLPQLLGESYTAIGAYLAELGEQPAGPPFCAYYNMDMQDLDVEIGFAVAEKLPGRGDIQAGELPAGTIGSCIFIGPYVEMETAYEALASYVTEQGHEPTGVAYEFYLNDPTEVPVEESVTQIVYTLK